MKTQKTAKANLSKPPKQINWPRIFGYDFFISFKAQSYASDLARRLRELDYTVFYSEEEASPGAVLDTTLVKALRRSKILLVVANEGALLHSQWVRKEVEEFRRKYPKRPVIPINVDKAIETFGSHVEAAIWLGHEGRIWLDESKEALNEGIITQVVFNRLQVVPRFTKANTKFKCMVTAIFFLLVGLTLWAVREAYDAKLKFKQATAIRLTVEGNTMAASLRSDRQLLGLLNVLAGHRLLTEKGSGSAGGLMAVLTKLAGYRQPSLVNTYAALQTQYNQFVRLLFWRETSSPIRAVAFSPDSKTLVSGSDDKTLRLWDAATGKSLGDPLKGHDGYVSGVAFSPDGKTIVSGSEDSTLRLWDAASGKALDEPLKGHKEAVTSVDFSPDGKTIVSGSEDSTVRLWDAASGKALGEPLNGHFSTVTSVAFSPDGKKFVSGSYDNTLRLWDTATGKTIGEPSLDQLSTLDAVTSVAFSPDGEIIAAGNTNKTLTVWSPIGKLFVHKVADIIDPLQYVDPGDRVTSIAFSPDRDVIVYGTNNGILRFWDRSYFENDNESIEPLKAHDGTVNSIAFSPDGKVFVSVSDDKTLNLWDSYIVNDTFGELSKDFGALAGALSGDKATLTPDGKVIVSVVGINLNLLNNVKVSVDDKNLNLWNISPGNAIKKELKGHENLISSVAFSQDGKMIVSGSLDKTLRLWDTATGNTIGGPFKGHKDEVNCVDFSPDGKTIIYWQ